MKKEIKQIDGEKKMVRITTVDERWYAKEIKDQKTGLPVFKFRPSSTWIASHYPKGIQFYKWLAEHGWDESEALKNAAAQKGSKIHHAIELLTKGTEISIDQKILNVQTGQDEEITLEEYEALMSFKDWFEEVKPRVLYTEVTVESDQYDYAGTIDLICEIAGEYWVVDFKTGQHIWPEYELQLSSYRQAVHETFTDYASMKELAGKELKLGILQIGYKLNKRKFKFTEIQDKFPLFLAARQIWAEENSKVEPKQKDYPMSIKLDLGTISKVKSKE